MLFVRCQSMFRNLSCKPCKPNIMGQYIIMRLRDSVTCSDNRPYRNYFWMCSKLVSCLHTGVVRPEHCYSYSGGLELDLPQNESQARPAYAYYVFRSLHQLVQHVTHATDAHQLLARSLQAIPQCSMTIQYSRPTANLPDAAELRPPAGNCIAPTLDKSATLANRQIYIAFMYNTKPWTTCNEQFRI